MDRKKRNSAPSSGRTWKEIRQSAPGKAITPAARKRQYLQLLKASGAILGLIILGAGLAWAVGFFHGRGDRPLISESSEPIRRILFASDGTLDERWVERALSIPAGTPLLQANLFELKRRLLAEGQVADAVVERSFPDTLVVRISERVPVVRVAVRGDFGEVQTLLVAQDGVVYQGFNYSEEMLQDLPFLDGVRLRRQDGGGYHPLAGMETVAYLLNLAKREYPLLYRDWRVVSLQYFGGDARETGSALIVRGRRMGEVLFSPRGFESQLARLDYILEDLRRRDSRASRTASIDLSLEGPAVVSFVGRGQP